jgi:NAD-dependent SIR2 family protein deacetylase
LCSRAPNDKDIPIFDQCRYSIFKPVLGFFGPSLEEEEEEEALKLMNQK